MRSKSINSNSITKKFFKSEINNSRYLKYINNKNNNNSFEWSSNSKKKSNTHNHNNNNNNNHNHKNQNNDNRDYDDQFLKKMGKNLKKKFLTAFISMYLKL